MFPFQRCGFDMVTHGLYNYIFSTYEHNLRKQNEIITNHVSYSHIMSPTCENVLVKEDAIMDNHGQS